MSETSEEIPAGPESYEAAVERLEAIVAELDSGRAELRQTLELTREAKGLIEFCRTELETVSGQLQELGLDDLVARLEAPQADGS
jgi:exodeoxyribonuclease VII small subunit